MSTMPDLKQNKLLSTIVHSLHRHHMTIAAHPGHSGINEFQSRKYKLVYPLTLLLIREAASIKNDDSKQQNQTIGHFGTWYEV